MTTVNSKSRLRAGLSGVSVLWYSTIAGGGFPDVTPY